MRWPNWLQKIDTRGCRPERPIELMEYTSHGQASKTAPVGSLRAVARRLGVTKLLPEIRALYRIGARATINRSLVRTYLLPRIQKAPAIAAGEGAMELHMLLHKARLLEGVWALYSFLYYAGQPLRAVIHSDGSLDANCTGILSGLFPGAVIISRAEADSSVNATLKERGLHRCIELRQRHILGLKLLDPFLFSRTDTYLMLDSDILTFSKPAELFEPNFGAANGTALHLYGLDCSDGSYALSAEQFRAAGVQPAYRLNSGILKIQRSALRLERIEETIFRLGLLDKERIHMFAEQTLYACELPCHGVVGLDPERYTICGDPNNGKIVTGHYCGDHYQKTRFYREGIPRLARELPLGAG
jgi:hypothetical protein